ncbi:blue-sensitive opsin-like [Myiozetetes cayanensis]|uniref:blue-sensitive opsin-like n=1 Tax=Myiozetetes cayanensis TaxID=478635 RepID=UPI00215E9077|nr:blue-sensitive opsin-like [Myiozetetes cayanensis]
MTATDQYGHCDHQYGDNGHQYGSCDHQYGHCDHQYGHCDHQYGDNGHQYGSCDHQYEHWGHQSRTRSLPPSPPAPCPPCAAPPPPAMQKPREMRDELPEDFYIPMSLETPNLTALSPFLVPQTHLGSPGVFKAMAVFMFLLISLGLPINGLTIVCTAKYKKLRSHLNYILVNLAVANLLVICVGSTTAFYSFSQMYFALGPTACKIEGFVATLGGFVSLWSLAVVAFERFLVICKPLGNFTFRGSHAVLGCAITWIFSLIASVPPLFGWSRYIPEGLQCSCGPDLGS